MTRLARPAILLRLEGLTLAVASVVLFDLHDGNWLLFVLLILAPDLAALGYLAGTRVGAATYNVAHISLLPALLAGYGWWADSSVAISLALLWLTHIGVDRALGYGLKYPSNFKDTHLQRL